MAEIVVYSTTTTMTTELTKKQRKNKKKNILEDTNGNEGIQPLKEVIDVFTPPLVGWTKTKIYDILDKKMNTPKTGKQQDFVDLLKDKNKKIILVCGPAGTGKTLFSTQYGIKNFLLGTYQKIIFTRPTISVDENIGFLPGTLEDKMSPWIRPIYDVINQFITQKEIEQLIEEKKIEISPLGFMRGRTFKNTWIVADEMQNCTVEQMKMLMTRLGENSRLIITGDLEQSDLQRRLNGLDDFLMRFKDRRSDSITSFEFENKDIQREEVIKEILDIYYSPPSPTNI
jgi:phosphate starvation-inducible PhoH-like protein